MLVTLGTREALVLCAIYLLYVLVVCTNYMYYMHVQVVGNCMY